MKTFILYASLAFTGMVNAQKACVDGEKLNVSPGYTVQYQCGKYRDGTRYDYVMSHKECAVLCERDGRDVCTYNEGRKFCMVGNPYGKEGKHEDYTLLIKVKEEDPFPEDPHPMTCEEQRDVYKAKLDQCRADVKKRSEEKEKRAEEEEKKRIEEELKKRSEEKEKRAEEEERKRVEEEKKKHLDEEEEKRIDEEIQKRIDERWKEIDLRPLEKGPQASILRSMQKKLAADTIKAEYKKVV